MTYGVGRISYPAVKSKEAHMGNRNEDHKRICRIFNLRRSKEKLEQLLLTNFRDGAQLVTLTYGPGTRVPAIATAIRQLQDWVRTVGRVLGYEFLYVRAIEWEDREHGHHVHRVVLGLPAATVADIVPIWEYGPVTVQAVQGEELEAVAELMMAQAIKAGQGPARKKRVWTPSFGMLRPGMDKDA